MNKRHCYSRGRGSGAGCAHGALYCDSVSTKWSRLRFPRSGARPLECRPWESWRSWPRTTELSSALRGSESHASLLYRLHESGAAKDTQSLHNTARAISKSLLCALMCVSNARVESRVTEGRRNGPLGMLLRQSSGREMPKLQIYALGAPANSGR